MPRLNRANASTILFVFLAITSIGLVAATIDETVAGPSLGEDPGDAPDAPGGATEDRIQPNLNASDGDSGTGAASHIDLVICLEFLTSPLAILGIFVVVTGILFGFYHRYNLATAGLFATGIIPIVLLLYFFLTNCPEQTGGVGDFMSGSDAISGSPDGIFAAPPIPPALIAILFGGIMIAAVVLLFTMSGEEETYEPIEEEEPMPDAADFARAAGLAADRIEKANVAVDNAVYRAWLEMTDLLSIENPKTTAPMDFAEAAIEVGLGREDVYELTQLFTEVRYGGKDAENREERAIEVLRNIEQQYQDTAGTEADDR